MIGYIEITSWLGSKIKVRKRERLGDVRIEVHAKEHRVASLRIGFTPRVV